MSPESRKLIGEVYAHMALKRVDQLQGTAQHVVPVKTPVGTAILVRPRHEPLPGLESSWAKHR